MRRRALTCLGLVASASLRLAWSGVAQAAAPQRGGTLRVAYGNRLAHVPRALPTPDLRGPPGGLHMDAAMPSLSSAPLAVTFLQARSRFLLRPQLLTRA